MTVWQFIAKKLAKGIGTVLMAVVDHEGSTPGKASFKMAVAADGTRYGTIGGGIMEIKLVEQAEAMASQGGRSRLVIQRHQERGPEDERSGMICSGIQRVALLPVSDLELVTHIQQGQGFCLTAQGLTADPHRGGPEFTQADGAWTYREREQPARVYVIGGGHVGSALCRVLALTDFHTTCFDHRAELDSFQANTAADEKETGNYTRLTELVVDESYAVIVTTAYTSDVAALLALSEKPMRFVGLMGSAAKIKRIMSTLREKGVSESWLDKIVAPVGLPINNETPTEIGISIAAQLIHTKNTR